MTKGLKMKQALLGLLMFISAMSLAHGQGGNVISFSNRDLQRGINAPFYDADGTTRLSGDNFRAALYWGPGASPEQMVQVGAARVFLTGTSAGYWQPANYTIAGPGPAPGQPIYVQVRFWDSQGGAYNFFESAYAARAKIGFSEVLQLTPEPFGQTIPLRGLKSTSLIEVYPVALGETRAVIDVMNVPNGLQLSPLCAQPVGRIRWFHLIFANPGEAVVRTEGDSIDTVLSVFTSCLLSSNNCAPVACSDDAAVRFQAQAGVNYAVAVGGNNGATGALHLTFSMPVALAAERAANRQVDISWPAEATEFALEVNTNLALPEWHPVEGVPTVSGNRKWLRVPPEGQRSFYRLKRNTTP